MALDALTWVPWGNRKEEPSTTQPQELEFATPRTGNPDSSHLFVVPNEDVVGEHLAFTEAEIDRLLGDLGDTPEDIQPIDDLDAPLELQKREPREHTEGIKNSFLERAREAYAQLQETTDTVRYRVHQKKYSLLLKLGLTAEQRQNARELVAVKKVAEPDRQRDVLEGRVIARMEEVREQIAKLDEQIEHTSLFGPKTLSYSFKRMLPMFARNLNNESHEKSMAIGELEAKKARLAQQLLGLMDLHGEVSDRAQSLESLDTLRNYLGV